MPPAPPARRRAAEGLRALFRAIMPPVADRRGAFYACTYAFFDALFVDMFADAREPV